LEIEEIDMKIAGIALVIFAALLVLSSINLGITQYDFHSSHDISKFAGGFAFAVIVFVCGIKLINRSKRDRES
jgi:membrane protein YdbS with pleckstrin-like domain